MGYIDKYLSFDDLPFTLSIGNSVLNLQKSERISGILSNESAGFLHFANGFGTAFRHDIRHIYIFDPHSRDNQGFVSPNGTSVLLKFKTLSDAENYYKHFFLTQANFLYEYQLYSMETSDKCLHKIKEYFAKEKTRRNVRHCPTMTGEKAIKLHDQISPLTKWQIIVKISHRKKKRD